MSKSVPIRLKPKDAAQAFVEAGEEPRASDFRKPVKTAARQITVTTRLIPGFQG